MGIEQKNGKPNLDVVLRALKVIPSNIFYKDRDLKYRYVSHHWIQVTGDDILGKTDYDIRKDRDNVEVAMEADREILRTGKGCRYTIKSEVDGQTNYLELLKEPVFNDAGEAIGIVGLINDITEKTVLDQNLRAMAEQLEMKCEELEQRNKSQKMFTASINHELRSPLNGIIGLLQILMEDQSLSDSQAEHVENAYRSSQFLLEIVNDLLDFSKMETNDFTIHRDEFDLRDIVSNVVQSMSKLAEEKGLAFELKIQDRTYCKYLGDDVRIKQVLYNILSNAIKYTDAGSVTLGIYYEAGRLHLCCSDTGQGIAAESMDKLFDPYVRLDENRNKYINGTGLGLSIVNKLVNRMGGEIKVSSELKKGTVFEIVLPLPVCDERAFMTDKKDNRDRNNSGTITDLSHLKVLMIDDTKINHSVFKGLLRETGIQIDSAMSGREGLDKAMETRYDIVFIDYNMPEMSGNETLENMRREGANCNTPAVLLTANVGEEYEREAEEMGFDRFLTKPILKEKLINEICSLKG